jgi:hypothetical protein
MTTTALLATPGVVASVLTIKHNVAARYSAGTTGCVRCGGRLQVIASIEAPELIERILAHRREQGGEDAPRRTLGARAPPQASLF